MATVRRYGFMKKCTIKGFNYEGRAIGTFYAVVSDNGRCIKNQYGQPEVYTRESTATAVAGDYNRKAGV